MNNRITGDDVVRALKELGRSVPVAEISHKLGGADTRAIATAARQPRKDGRITMRYPHRGAGALYRFVRIKPGDAA